MAAIILSIIFPGLGNLSQGDKPGGLALMSAALGLILLCMWDLSWFTTIFVVLAYFSLIWHSVRDMQKGTRHTESIQYVLGLSAVVGPFALPLLWQNRSIHTRAKKIWTAVILFITVLLVLGMIYVDPMIERTLQTYQRILTT
ncbi:MAG: hypothetical protein V4534_04390 [Myxococcota bacterium]